MCTVKGAQVEAQSEYSYTCVFEINGQTLQQKVSTDFIGNEGRFLAVITRYEYKLSQNKTVNK